MFFAIPTLSPRPSGTGILASIGIPATGAEAPAYFQSASPRRLGVASNAPGAALRAALCNLDIWKTEIVLRRSKIFIVIGIPIALSSVGAAYYAQHLHTDLHPFSRCRGGGI